MPGTMPTINFCSSASYKVLWLRTLLLEQLAMYCNCSNDYYKAFQLFVGQVRTNCAQILVLHLTVSILQHAYHPTGCSM